MTHPNREMLLDDEIFAEGTGSLTHWGPVARAALRSFERERRRPARRAVFDAQVLAEPGVAFHGRTRLRLRA